MLRPSAGERALDAAKKADRTAGPITVRKPIASQIGIVVASCDGYSDLWPACFYCLRRAWPDCPFEVYLVANSRESGIAGVRTVRVGSDQGWSSNLARALGDVPHPYVLLLLEDLLMLEPVDDRGVRSTLERAVDASVACLKLNPVPPPDRPHDDLMGLVSPGGHYRVSTVATLWKKAVLAELLRAGETAWEFELQGSVRSDAWNRFYACWRPHLPVSNAVVRGAWHPAILRRAERWGAPIDRSVRRVMSRLDRLRYACARARSGSLALLPAKVRRAVRRVFLGTPRADSAGLTVDSEGMVS